MGRAYQVASTIMTDLTQAARQRRRGRPIDKIVIAVDDIDDRPGTVSGKCAEILDRRLARLMPYDDQASGHRSR
jgi:hypothetical protein